MESLISIVDLGENMEEQLTRIDAIEHNNYIAND